MAAPVNIDAEPSAGAVNTAAQQNGVDPEAVPNILNAIDDLVATNIQGGALRTQMQTQPCQAAGFIREIMATVISDKVTWRNGWADKAENFLEGWITESILRRGMPGGGLAGGKSLGAFMVEFGPRSATGSKLIPEPARTLLLGTLPERDWIMRHLPSGSAIASGAWVQETSAPREVRENGQQLARGVYLYPAGNPADLERQGSKLRGPAVASLIFQWIKFQAENVSGLDWNGIQGPRETLIKMVGTWKGSGRYGLWQKSDGARQGSRVYAINLLWDDANQLLEEASALCTSEWQQEQQQAQLAAQLSAQQAVADIETAAQQADTQQQFLLGLLALAGLFVVTNR